MEQLANYSITGILDEIQRVQREDFGKRGINIDSSPMFLSITIFENGYEEKSDYNLKNFTFYDFMDKYALEAEWKRLMDYYNG